MSKPLSRKYKDEYESDGGFVEDAPKNKKRKNESNNGKVMDGETQKDEDGNEYWELSGKRRVQISEFKNATFINIREYYEKDGKALPGKKGISLAVDQYKALIELLPQIESALRSRGVDVPRPSYDDGDHGQGTTRKPDDRETREAEDEPRNQKPSAQLEKYKLKKNHEATSDEDSS